MESKNKKNKTIISTGFLIKSSQPINKDYFQMRANQTITFHKRLIQRIVNNKTSAIRNQSVILVCFVNLYLSLKMQANNDVYLCRNDCI